MLNQFVDNIKPNSYPAIANASIAGYFIIDNQKQLYQSGGFLRESFIGKDSLFNCLPMLQYHFDNPNAPGMFYKIDNQAQCSILNNKHKVVYIGSIPGENKILGIVYDEISSRMMIEPVKTENFILSLITQAVRAFNRADDFEDILKIVLIGVTAGSGLGFNRAYILLTCDQQKSLKGALANGPSSPEEAGLIWQKLTRGELTLEMMFDDALKKDDVENTALNGFVKELFIPLDNMNNIFVRSALEKKSMIIDEMTLLEDEYSELQSKIGPGPLAVVPLVGKEYLQGVLIADNFITNKEITNNDIQLLEIFARYASDSIEKFRLYDRLEKKIEALKKANETIILSRENVIKAERLTVLSEMAREVAHEIRNPLTIIGGFTKSMLKKMSSDNENYETFNIIIDQVARVEQTIERFTSLMNYQIKDDRICDLGELVRSTLAIRPPGISLIRFDIHYEHPVTVKIDPDLFRQALSFIIKRIAVIQQCQDSILLSIQQYSNKAYIYFRSSCANGHLASDLYKSFNSVSNHRSMKDILTSLEILKHYGGDIGLEAASDEKKIFYLELPVYQEE